MNKLSLFWFICFLWSIIEASNKTIVRPSISAPIGHKSTPEKPITKTKSFSQVSSSSLTRTQKLRTSTIKQRRLTSNTKSTVGNSIQSSGDAHSPTTETAYTTSFTTDSTSATADLTSGASILTNKPVTAYLTPDVAQGITPPPPVSLEVDFLKELDELDEYMVNYTKFDSPCTRINPTHLSYCHNVDWLVPKNLALAPYFQDKMAKTAVETLNILTSGGTTQCEEKLKLIYCRQKFPECYDSQQLVGWEANETNTCLYAVNECSPEANKLLKKMKICDRLTTGTADIHKCIAPMVPHKEEICSRSNVSVWLYHGDVEINSLLNYQFALNGNLTSECKQGLTDHMCFMGLQCFSGPDFDHSKYSKKVKSNCDNVIEVCKEDDLSKGITNLFLDCNKFAPTT